MSDNKWIQYEKIAIKDLVMWHENARFPEEYHNENEKKLIDYFLNDEKFGIDHLAHEIVNDLDIPQFEPLLVLRLQNKNIVMEGNRRLAVYKLLSDYSLTDKLKFQKLFLELNKKANITDDFVLFANVVEDVDSANRYIDRKHNKSNNEISWTSTERSNFAVRRKKGASKDTFRVAMSKEVKCLDLPEEIKFTVLGKGYETIFWRIVENSSTRMKLGYMISGDGSLKISDSDTFKKLLKLIVYNVWNGEEFDGTRVNTRSLNKSTEIEDYSNRLTLEKAGKVSGVIESQRIVTPTLLGENKITKPSRSRSNSLPQNRKYLITSSIYIANPRINNIYNELRSKLVVDEAPNAVAVLFRVFMECSVDYYIENKKISISDNKLAGKILKSVNFLEEEKYQNYIKSQNVIFPSDDEKKKNLEKTIREKLKYKEIRKVATKDNNSILSCTTFHDFVHDHKISPIASELKTHWTNLEDFFSDLWQSVNNK